MAAKSSKPAPKAAPKMAKSAAKKAPAKAPKAKAPLTHVAPSEAQVKAAEHAHQDPRVGADHGHKQMGHDKHQHEGKPQAPRYNRVINWFRRGTGR